MRRTGLGPAAPPTAPCSLPAVTARSHDLSDLPSPVTARFFGALIGRGRVEFVRFGRMESPSANVCDECGASFDSKQKLHAHKTAIQQRISKRELRAEIRRLSDEVGRAPKAKEMADPGEYSPTTYLRRYDSRDDALAAAGVDPETRRKTPPEAIIEEIRRLADESGTAPTAAEIDERAIFGNTGPKPVRIVE